MWNNDSPEFIEMCKSCPKPECNNCLDGVSGVRVDSCRKAVDAFRDGVLVESYISVTAAAKAHHTSNKSISQACKTRRRFHSLDWRFHDLE